jgi:hypothetical protein
MSEKFELVDPEEAQQFLTTLSHATRRKGDAYFREGRVVALRCVEPGVYYEAEVRGGAAYVVSLRCDDLDGWEADCTCPREFDCKHVYAAMKALLAEHSSAVVQKISAGKAPKPAVLDQKPSVPALSAPFHEKVAAALGRPLQRDETKFLNKLNEVYRRCVTTRQINNWDFDQLGLSLGGYSWEPLKIWPAFPKDEHEFWLYVAHAARERGVRPPAWMAAVTDLSLIADKLAQWVRSKEIQKWRDLLSRPVEGRIIEARQQTEYDLRLVLEEECAFLEGRRAAGSDFERFKRNSFRRFSDEYDDGLIAMPAEAELLWELLQHHFLYRYGAIELRYNLPESREVLSRLLRMPTLEPRIVTALGQPFVRVAAPLRWEVTPAANADEDYRFCLVQADGSRLARLLFVVDGPPPLYVTADAIFTGPLHHPALDPGRENRIPAPALESPAGAQFLHALGLELPQRLRERVRQVPMQVAIRCGLQPLYPGSPSEACTVHVVAESADGLLQEAWTGSEWYETERSAQRRKGERNSELITLYDRSVLQPMLRVLEPLGLKHDSYTGCLSVRVTKKFPELFANWLKTVPPHITVHLGGELASFTQDAVVGKVRLDVTEQDIDWLDLKVVLNVTDTTLIPEEIKLLLNAKGGYVRLGKKGWRRLQFDLSQEEDEQLARLGLSSRELTGEPQRLHALQLADKAAKKFLPEAQVERVERRVNELKARVTPPLPERIQAQLRPYQLDGFHFLSYLAANRFGGILADDMGLGKTLQTLVWLAWLREEAQRSKLEAQSVAPEIAGPSAGPSVPALDSRPSPLDPATRLAASPAPLASPPLPSLVVCPKSVMDNWHAEAERFTPGLRVKAWSASELETFLDRLAEADLHVLNYSQLRIIGESLAPVRWLAVILDEGQYIKNPNSQTAQVARAVQAQHRLVLSGTPIENRLLDLWSLMAFAMPGVLGSRNQFAKLYDAKDDPFARGRLAARVRPFLLRRTKSQVAKDLPDRVEEDLYCEIEGEQKTLYRAELKRAQQLLLSIQTQKELNQERFNFLTSLLRLRQVCCDPRLVKPDSTAPSAKAEALLEQLEPLMDEGHKVLVFSQFVELLDLLQPLIVERGWPHFYLTGGTGKRGELIQNFQSTEGAAVFLLSLKAGGFGLNLTAASYVVLFDPWWNPAVENQAIDRTHRIGQTNKVIAYRLLIKGSIEEKIRQLQKQKSALAEDVLGEEKFAQALTLEDLQFLFAD